MIPLYKAGLEVSAKIVKGAVEAAPDVVEQFEAASSDGTRIPYFVVHRRDIRLAGDLRVHSAEKKKEVR